MKKAFRILATPPPLPLGIPGHLPDASNGVSGTCSTRQCWTEIAKCYVFWYLFWLHIWCNVECYLLLILSSLFSKHVNLHTKNNTIVHIATHMLAMGFGIMFPVNISNNWSNLVFLMHILKTFVLIHFRFCLLINTDIEWTLGTHFPANIG